MCAGAKFQKKILNSTKVLQRFLKIEQKNASSLILKFLNVSEKLKGQNVRIWSIRRKSSN